MPIIHRLQCAACLLLPGPACSYMPTELYNNSIFLVHWGRMDLEHASGEGEVIGRQGLGMHLTVRHNKAREGKRLIC
jgi:hypothetical protein